MSSSAYILLDHLPVLSKLEGVEGLNAATVTHTGLVALLLVGLGVSVKLASRGDRVLPLPAPFAIPNLMELGVKGLLDFMEGIMGKQARHFLPLVGTAFFFILFSNLLGGIPAFDSPTADLNTTLACALVVFFATHIVGFRVHGFGYLKQFLGPVWWLIPLMLPLELISHFARIISLSFRLFGNVSGDHQVVAAFISLTYLVVPVIFMGMGVFVAFVQAFVFALLTVIYISMAMEEHH